MVRGRPANRRTAIARPAGRRHPPRAGGGPVGTAGVCRLVFGRSRPAAAGTGSTLRPGLGKCRLSGPPRGGSNGRQLQRRLLGRRALSGKPPDGSGVRAGDPPLPRPFAGWRGRRILVEADCPNSDTAHRVVANETGLSPFCRNAADKGDSPHLPERPGGCCGTNGDCPPFPHWHAVCGNAGTAMAIMCGFGRVVGAGPEERQTRGAGRYERQAFCSQLGAPSGEAVPGISFTRNRGGCGAETARNREVCTPIEEAQASSNRRVRDSLARAIPEPPVAFCYSIIEHM